ncbi:MAG: right-handed parallel beta-helix repeat-containing protein [Rikenellaceae bacterium]
MKNVLLKSWVLALFAFSAFALSSCEKDEPSDLSGGDGGSTGVNSVTDLFPKLYDYENDQIKYTDNGESYAVQIYVNPTSGSDSNNGLSADSAIRSLDRLNTMIEASTQSMEILLYGGDAEGTLHRGSIVITSKSEPIRIGSYPTSGKKARIDTSGEKAAIWIYNTSDVYVSDIKISGNGGSRVDDARYAVLIQSNAVQMYNIAMHNIDIRDMFYYNEDALDIPYYRPCRQWGIENDFNYGWGFYANAVNSGAGIDGLDIIDCTVTNVSYTAFKGTAGSATNKIKNMTIDGCTSYLSGGPGSQFTYVDDSVMKNTKIYFAGSRLDPRFWGRGSGMWLMYCNDMTFDSCHFEGAEGIADSCGAHIDHNNTNIIIQRCLSLNNAGGFIAILGGNYNCTYRFNISINDGWRNPNDEAQRSHWGWYDGSNSATNGVLITLNGTQGSNWLESKNTYIYNNTIINTNDSSLDDRGYTYPFIYELTTVATGIVVQNNIFWIPEKMKYSYNSYSSSTGLDKAYNFTVNDGSGRRDMTQAELDAMKVTLDNNLYKRYDGTNMSSAYPLPFVGTTSLTETANAVVPEHYWDTTPYQGDPQFANIYSLTAEGAIPSNATLINSGKTITYISGDSTGIVGGFDQDTDFFGNPITTPIIGACVAQ